MVITWLDSCNSPARARRSLRSRAASFRATLARCAPHSHRQASQGSAQSAMLTDGGRQRAQRALAARASCWGASGDETMMPVCLVGAICLFAFSSPAVLLRSELFVARLPACLVEHHIASRQTRLAKHANCRQRGKCRALLSEGAFFSRSRLYSPIALSSIHIYARECDFVMGFLCVRRK